MISLGMHIQPDNVRRCMLVCTLGGTHGQMTSGVECKLRHWEANTVGQRWKSHALFPIGTIHMMGRRLTCHVIIALGQHTRSHYMWHSNAIITLGKHTRLDDVER